MTSNHNTRSRLAVGLMSAPEVDINFISGFESNGPRHFEAGSLESRLLIEPASADSVFEVGGITIGVGFHWQQRQAQRFAGAVELVPDGDNIVVINHVDVEDYLCSVISSEMNANSPLEFLKAHAVISRSWVLRQIGNRHTEINDTARCGADEIIRWYDREDHTLFDVCADDHCQRYQGISRVSTPVAAGAVADTRGMVLTFDGELCDTRFSKCCGGVFEVFETCWNDTPRPYLQPRRDGVDPTDFPDLTVEENAVSWILGKPEAFCNTTDRRVLSQVLNGYDRETPDFYRWTETLPQEKIARLVADRLGEDLGRILSLTPLTRGTSGRIRELKITGTKGERIIGKELMIRRTLSDSHLYSSAFVVEPLAPEADGTPSGFTLHGAGWGHGAGLCQIGAAIMGERGYGYSEILARYYPGSTLTKLY